MSEGNGALDEYHRADSEIERVGMAVRDAYDKARADRIDAERRVFEVAMAASRAGEDPGAAALAEIRRLGLPFVVDVASAEWNHGFAGIVRMQTTGACNDAYRRIVKAAP